MSDAACVNGRFRPGRRRLPAYAAVAGCACLGPAGLGAGPRASNPQSPHVDPGAAGSGGRARRLDQSRRAQLRDPGDALLTVLSLAPAVLLMTTCFMRIIVVLSLLRQAVGTQQLPPSQVITSLALFITLLIMSPVWKQVYDQAIVPYTHHQISLEQAWKDGGGAFRRL